MKTRPEVDPNDMRDAANLIWGALDWVAREQGDAAACVAAIKNVHGNVAWLRQMLGDVEVIELLGELRETVLARALNDLRQTR